MKGLVGWLSWNSILFASTGTMFSPRGIVEYACNPNLGAFLDSLARQSSLIGESQAVSEEV